MWRGFVGGMIGLILSGTRCWGGEAQWRIAEDTLVRIVNTETLEPERHTGMGYRGMCHIEVGGRVRKRGETATEVLVEYVPWHRS